MGFAGRRLCIADFSFRVFFFARLIVGQEAWIEHANVLRTNVFAGDGGIGVFGVIFIDIFDGIDRFEDGEQFPFSVISIFERRAHPSLEMPLGERRFTAIDKVEEIDDHLGSPLIPLRNVAFEGFHTNFVDGFWDHPIVFGWFFDRCILDHIQNGKFAFGLEQSASGEEFPEDDAECEDIGAMVDIFIGGLFGAHVAKFPFDDTALRVGCASRSF